MVDVEDDHDAVLLVDAITHPILTSTCPPQPFERLPQRSTNHPWSLTQRPADELPCSESCSRRKGALKCTARTRR
jgi:hypothetical protein